MRLCWFVEAQWEDAPIFPLDKAHKALLQLKFNPLENYTGTNGVIFVTAQWNFGCFLAEIPFKVTCTAWIVGPGLITLHKG